MVRYLHFRIMKFPFNDGISACNIGKITKKPWVLYILYILLYYYIILYYIYYIILYILYYIILYYIILYYIILYYIIYIIYNYIYYILYYIILYYIYYIILYYIILYYILFYSILFYSIIFYSILLYYIYINYMVWYLIINPSTSCLCPALLCEGCCVVPMFLRTAGIYFCEGPHEQTKERYSVLHQPGGVGRRTLYDFIWCVVYGMHSLRDLRVASPFSRPRRNSAPEIAKRNLGPVSFRRFRSICRTGCLILMLHVGLCLYQPRSSSFQVVFYDIQSIPLFRHPTATRGTPAFSFIFRFLWDFIHRHQR